jgi:hypothetical protein
MAIYSRCKVFIGFAKKKIKVRYSETPFEAAGKKFTAGSLLVTRAGNEKIDFDRVVTQIAAETWPRDYPTIIRAL